MAQIHSALSALCLLVMLSGDWMYVVDGCSRHYETNHCKECDIENYHESRKRRSVVEKAKNNEVFYACNSDTKDGLNLEEMKNCFHRPSHVLKKIFNQLDSDTDGTLSPKEFERASLNPGYAADANCHTNMLNRCGYIFMLYSRARVPSQTTMCGALQAYIDCVGTKRQTCDTDETQQYTSMLSEMVATTSEEGICPNITTDGLGSSKVPDMNFDALPCSKSAIMLCDISLMEDLHRGAQACSALDVYKSCMYENRLGCDDEPSEEALKAADDILQAYLSTGMCS